MDDDKDIIIIDLKDDNDFIEISKNELPNDANEIIDVLINESSNIDKYIEIATVYYGKDLPKEYEKLINKGLELSFDNKNKLDEIKLYQSYATFKGLEALKAKYIQKEPIIIKKLFDEALNFAKQIRMISHSLKQNLRSSYTITGLIYLFQDDLSSAKDEFEKAINDINEDNQEQFSNDIIENRTNKLLALLGLANIQLKEDQTKEAIETYTNILKEYPNSPSSAQ